jgi:catechol 2,3-dioxygenase-like lactoylglutathione lyase family enzyme
MSDAGNKVHHSAICTLDMASSLRFWRDGIGLREQMDETFKGDWPTLFGSREPTLRSIFLGDPDDTMSGLVELVEFEGGVAEGSAPPSVPTVGFFLLSVYTSVEETLARLTALGLGGPPRRITLSVGVEMAVVRDPNGVLVELIDTSQATSVPGAAQ